MKIEYEFRLFRDKFKKFEKPFKHLEHRSSNNSVYVIKILQNHPDFQKVLNLLKDNPTIGLSPLALNKYTEEEMLSAEILYVDFIAPVPNEMFGEDYGTKYKILAECPWPEQNEKEPSLIDKTDNPTIKQTKLQKFINEALALQVEKAKHIQLRKKISTLRINTSKLSDKKDIQQTFSDEIIISKRLKKILEDNDISGYQLEPIYRPKKITENGDSVDYVSDNDKKSENWFVLDINSVGGYSVPPTKYGIHFHSFNKIDQTEYDPKYIRECGKYRMTTGPGIGSAFYFNGNEWPKTDIARPEELDISQYFKPFMIISQKLYRILVENDVKGFKVEPAYFVNNQK